MRSLFRERAGGMRVKRLIVPLNPKGLDFVHRIRRIRCRVPPARISKFGNQDRDRIDVSL